MPDLMEKILETERLLIRKFNVDDAPFVLELVNTPGWLRYIGNRGIRTIEEAQIYLLTGPMANYEKLGFGLYLVELKNDGLPIGMCGLIKREGLDDVDIGFAFLPDFEGLGYGSEAAKATLGFGLKDLQIKNIVSITQENNLRAIRLLENLGFVSNRKVRLPHEELDLLLFERLKV